MSSFNRRELEEIYKNDAIFWCRDAHNLPAPAQLQAATKEKRSGVLLFAGDLSDAEKMRCIETLQPALPDAKFHDAGIYHGFDRVRFRRVLPRDEIISHAPELMDAAREFTRLAHDLCGQLAQKIGISTTQLSLCGRFLPPEIDFEQVGVLNADWKYFFHGLECGFSRRETGQHLDVVFGFRDEFGDIGASFWHQFIETTPRYAALSNWLALDTFDVQNALEVLIEVGFLVEIESSPDFVVQFPAGVAASWRLLSANIAVKMGKIAICNCAVVTKLLA